MIFRKLHNNIDKICALLPHGTPVLATSATAASAALDDVCSSLNIDLGTSFFLNFGNDRPNNTPSFVRLNISDYYAALNAVLPKPEDVKNATDLPKTIIFANAIEKTHAICQHVRKIYGSRFNKSIAYLHAHRTRRAKHSVMRKFRQGKIRKLVATEAAGMVHWFD